MDSNTTLVHANEALRNELSLLQERAARLRRLLVRARSSKQSLLARIDQLSARDAVRNRNNTVAQYEHERAQLVAREREQDRIGRELHDNLGQRLTGVAFLAKALEQQLLNQHENQNEEPRAQAAWIVRLINEAIDHVRYLSRNLCPIELDDGTLALALGRLLSDIRVIYGVQAALGVSGETTDLSGAAASQLYRIAQEATNNALRHGRATRITVRLCVIGQTLRLTIRDNGSGFQQAQNGDGLGLRSMRMRARSLNGQLRVFSGACGTLIYVRAPHLHQRRLTLPFAWERP